MYKFILLFNRMHELGISAQERKVFFGQLLGMSDAISFTLGMWLIDRLIVQNTDKLTTLSLSVLDARSEGLSPAIQRVVFLGERKTSPHQGV